MAMNGRPIPIQKIQMPKNFLNAKKISEIIETIVFQAAISH